MQEYYSYILFGTLLIVVGIGYSLLTGGEDPWEDDVELDDISVRKAGVVPLLLMIGSLAIAVYWLSWWGLLAVVPFWGLMLPIYSRLQRKRGFSADTRQVLTAITNKYGFTKTNEPTLAPRSDGPGSIGGEPFMMRVWGSKRSLCVKVIGLGRKSTLFIPWAEIPLLAVQKIAPIERSTRSRARAINDPITVANVDLEPDLGAGLIVPWSPELSDFVAENRVSSVISR